VHDQPLVVLDGVSVDDLQRGPRHDPDAALPGHDGNVVVAGTHYPAMGIHWAQGTPTLTLTTCNPRSSSAQRLVVHAELVS
jgi:sortase (surface protein transpeptidase)